MTEGGKQTPVLWCHGDADNVVEYANARVGCPRLQSAGVACELKVSYAQCAWMSAGCMESSCFGERTADT